MAAAALSLFWALRQLDPQARDDQVCRIREGHLAELFEQAGHRRAAGGADRRVHHSTFGSGGNPSRLELGPAGAFVASLDADRRSHSHPLRVAAHASVRLTASAWLSSRQV